MKKKILYLSQLFPYPPDGGGKIKTLNTLQSLAKEYHVYAIFISEEKPTASDLHHLTKLGIRVKIFYSDRILASVKDDLVDLFWHFFRGIPHYVFQYTYKPAMPFIQKAINDFKPDVIHIDHLNMAQYLPEKKEQIWILESHNVEFYLYWTRFIHSGKFTRKLYLLIELILTYLFERKTLKLFDHIFAISVTEKQRLERFFKLKNITPQSLVYPTSIIKHTATKNPYILFIGNLGWPPNEDALEWFLQEIFPLINKQIPQVQFHVVGKRQPRYEKNWPKPKNLYLHGFQKSLKPYLSRADVFVMPFRMGGGMRIKSLTALSAAIPLVTTPLGVEGLKVKNHLNCLIARQPELFSKYVIITINQKKLNRKLRINGQKYISRFHNEENNFKFLKKYSEIIKVYAYKPG